MILKLEVIRFHSNIDISSLPDTTICDKILRKILTFPLNTAWRTLIYTILNIIACEMYLIITCTYTYNFEQQNVQIDGQ